MLAIGLWGSASIKAGTILDQTNVGYSNTLFSDIYKSLMPEVGQTFTAGVTGTLSKVALGIYEDQIYFGTTPAGYYHSDALITIRDQSGKILGQTIIPSSDIPLSTTFNQQNPVNVSVDVRSLGIQLTSGQVYSVSVTALRLAPTSAGGNGLDIAATSATYLDGHPFNTVFGGSRTPVYEDTLDLAFQTFVDVPGDVIDLQGGTPTLPMILVGADFPPSGISMDLGGTHTESFYRFYFRGGSFTASATIGLPCCDGDWLTASYLLQLLRDDGKLISEKKLSSSNGFSGGVANAPDAIHKNPPLAPGYYLIGVRANTGVDPTATIYFQTPLADAPVPEPATYVAVGGGVAAIALMRYYRRR